MWFSLHIFLSKCGVYTSLPVFYSCVLSIRIISIAYESNNYGKTQALNAIMKNLSSYSSVRLNPSAVLVYSVTLLLLLFHIRPTAYEKEGTAVSVYMLKVL